MAKSALVCFAMVCSVLVACGSDGPADVGEPSIVGKSSDAVDHGKGFIVTGERPKDAYWVDADFDLERFAVLDSVVKKHEGVTTFALMCQPLPGAFRAYCVYVAPCIVEALCQQCVAVQVRRDSTTVFSLRFTVPSPNGSSCPAIGSVCQRGVCEEGQCVLASLPDGTACGAVGEGECQQEACYGGRCSFIRGLQCHAATNCNIYFCNGKGSCEIAACNVLRCCSESPGVDTCQDPCVLSSAANGGCDYTKCVNGSSTCTKPACAAR